MRKLLLLSVAIASLMMAGGAHAESLVTKVQKRGVDFYDAMNKRDAEKAIKAKPQAVKAEDQWTRQTYDGLFDKFMGEAIECNAPPEHSCDGGLCREVRTLPHVKKTTVVLTSFSNGVSQWCAYDEDNTGFCQTSKGRDVDMTFDGQHWQEGKINSTHFDGE